MHCSSPSPEAPNVPNMPEEVFPMNNNDVYLHGRVDPGCKYFSVLSILLHTRPILNAAANGLTRIILCSSYSTHRFRQLWLMINTPVDSNISLLETVEAPERSNHAQRLKNPISHSTAHSNPVAGPNRTSFIQFFFLYKWSDLYTSHRMQASH
jgi:hypothetical protein